MCLAKMKLFFSLSRSVDIRDGIHSFESFALFSHFSVTLFVSFYCFLCHRLSPWNFKHQVEKFHAEF